jgi:hypothetical protein
MREKQPRTATLIGLLTVLGFAATLHSQGPQYLHPPPQPQASDFPQPPSDGPTHWSGPVIRAANVKCWSAEPSAPSKFLGGEHGTQQITAFVGTSDPTSPPIQLDTSFHQTTLDSFSGGGKISDLKAQDLPPGIFVSLKGHPVIKVTSVHYPIQDHDYIPVFGPLKTGVRVTIDFMHDPGMGECYLYVAVWTAVKSPPVR